MTNMPYRTDVDGLRAVSVLVVILFHAGVAFAEGGYVGVDVFFVISGYLITGMIVVSLERGDFSLGDFYRRRMARILPSLALTLLFTLAIGFLLFDTRQFDALGKETAAAAFGLSNVLFSFGVDYFADERTRPLLHTWSLGVEEQFYLVWPAVLIVVCGVWRVPAIIMIAVALAAAFTFSALSTHADRPASYFLLQYRAYELLIGAMTFEIERRTRGWLDERPGLRTMGAAAGCVAIVVAVLYYDKSTNFPGHAALLPTIGVAVLILLAPGTMIGATLSWRPLVFLGRISYPLYLLHLPIMVFARILVPGIPTGGLIFLSIILGSAASWLIYRYIESPLRQRARRRSAGAWSVAVGLAGVLVVTAGVGMHIARENGWPWRLAYLNSFAYVVNQKQSNPFTELSASGYQVDERANRGRVLFVGDSVLQQYVPPFLSALRLAARDVDIVSRGDCLMLEGLTSVDYVAGVSCAKLQKQLYGSSKTYDLVVIAQNWEGYIRQKNAPIDGDREFRHELETVLAGLIASIAKLKSRSGEIVVVGWSPHVNVSTKLTPNIFLDRLQYRDELVKLKVINRESVERGDERFREVLSASGVKYLEPFRVWCPGGTGTCRLHDGDISYFYDAVHFGRNAVPAVAERLRTLLPELGIRTHNGRGALRPTAGPLPCRVDRLPRPELPAQVSHCR